MEITKNHGLMMALGCLVPILMLFILPQFGIRGSWLTILAVVAMMVCHLLMMGGHGGQGRKEDSNVKNGSPDGEKKRADGAGLKRDGACH